MRWDSINHGFMFYETIKLANKIKSKVAKYNAVLY